MPCGIFKGCGNVAILKVGIILEDFRACGAASQQVQDVGHTYPLTANAGAATANLRVGRDTL